MTTIAGGCFAKIHVTNSPFPPSRDVVQIDAASNRNSLVIRDAVEVRRDPVDADDFMVTVRASALRRWRKQLIRIRDSKLQLDDLAVGVACGALGAWVTLPVPGPTDSKWLPQGLLVLGVAAGVAYFFLKLRPHHTAKDTATDIISDLPDPDKITPG